MRIIYLKTPNQLRKIEYVNKLGAELLEGCYRYIKVGTYTSELEDLVIKFCESRNVEPAFYGYKGFPHRLCVSVNDEIIHGFPRDYMIKDGDVVSVDLGLIKDGYVSDAAFTKVVGVTSKRTRELVKITKECLDFGIEVARSGKRVRDISRRIYRHAVRNNFDVLRQFTGHGVGLALHELPPVHNYVPDGVDWKLKPGMIIAIEPMLLAGSCEYTVDANGWTVRTADGEKSAHFEHSVAITQKDTIVLSQL